jgi:Zn-dependent alcohol dehydrogenase
MGRYDTPNFSYECAGVVKRVGSNVTSLQRNDRVLAFAPGRFNNIYRAKTELISQLRDTEDFKVSLNRFIRSFGRMS